MTRRIHIVAALGVTICVACKAPAPAPAPTAQATPSARKLPVAEDFQAETAAAIVQANYRAELDALETELHAEAK